LASRFVHFVGFYNTVAVSARNE